MSPAEWAPLLARLRQVQDQQVALLRLPGARRLQYSEKHRPSRQHVVLPPDVLDDDEQFVEWLHHAAVHTKRTTSRTESRQ